MLNSIFADMTIALVFSVLLMLITWLTSVKIKNAGLVDIAWSGGFTLMAILYYLICDGWVTRKLLITLVVMSWSLRLAIHLFKRVMKEHPLEDSRYVEMRKSFGKNASFKFFLFFESQALVLALLSAPILLIAENARQSFGVLEIVGLGLFVVALTGESIADGQLAAFKKRPENKGAVCDIGLWNYSRHPNYFFEWLIWVAFFVIACDADYGLWTAFCPALMLFFLLKVSGVPLAEQQSLKSKGEKYRQYQNTTSVFFPWFKKEA